MLAEHSIDVMLTAPDLGAAKRFYGDRVGLEVLIDSDDFVTFRCGGDSRLVVTHSTVAGIRPDGSSTGGVAVAVAPSPEPERDEATAP
jgi:extradiol dioxygenase family protein